jgi:hypothetical protein
VSIPYRSVLDEDERNVSGAFFRTMPIDRDAHVGGLLLIDARGEPIEFTYNRVGVKHRFLWRDRDLSLALARELLTSLLDNCPRTPSGVFCLASEVEAQLFVEDIDIQMPLARVAGGDATVGLSSEEEHERLEGAQSVQLFWMRGRPSDATPAHRLVERLASRGLLLEPFERVLAGLREAYEISVGETDSSDS